MAQINRDKKAISLLKLIDEVYNFVREAEPLRKIQMHEESIRAMSMQTLESAYFLSSNFQDSNFGKQIQHHSSVILIYFF